MLYRARVLPPFLLLSLAFTAGCAGSEGTPDAGPLPVDQCLNANDLGILEALVALSDAGLPDGGVPDGGPYPLSFQQQLTPAFSTCALGSCLDAILTDDQAEQS